MQSSREPDFLSADSEKIQARDSSLVFAESRSDVADPLAQHPGAEILQFAAVKQAEDRDEACCDSAVSSQVGAVEMRPAVLCFPCISRALQVLTQPRDSAPTQEEEAAYSHETSALFDAQPHFAPSSPFAMQMEEPRQRASPIKQQQQQQQHNTPRAGRQKKSATATNAAGQKNDLRNYYQVVKGSRR